jgi:heptaprenyl diphosphate synthase
VAVTRLGSPGLEAPDRELEAELRDRLNQVEDSLEKAVRSDTEFVSEAASYLVKAGGKRFRPLLVLLSGYFGDPTDPRLVQGAMAIEMTHLATLYHDDVVDEADTRRGRPSVNARWDNTVAILTGDFLFAKASEISSDLGSDVTRLLARTIATVCDGQLREVAASGRIDMQSEDSYMETIRRKTASLMATSCRLGGMLSDASPGVVDRLDDFGMAIGLAFQLSDDIMDIISTEEELRKEPGQDMREGVYTLPVLYALQQGEGTRELTVLLTEGPLEGESFARALDLLRSDGSLGRARDAVTNQVRRAKALAEGLEDGRARRALIHIAEFISERCGAKL